MRRIVLFTTSIISEHSIEKLLKLFNSINYDHRLFQVKHYVLLQNTLITPTQLGFLPSNVSFMHSEKVISLSKARNIMIKRYLEDGEHNDDIFGFPDDDCFYFGNNFSLIMEKIMEEGIDVFVCKYGDSNNVEFFGKSFEPEFSVLIKNASSATMFIKRDMVDQIFFDERLGIGADINGAEDLDYVIKAYSKAKIVKLTFDKLIYHKSSDPKLRHRYYPGSYLVLKKYSNLGFKYNIQYIRKFFIGIYYVLLGRLELKKFINLLTQTI